MTRAALLAVPLLLLPLLATTTQAADATTIELVATEVDGRPTFLDASGAANPTLHATPGAHITIHLVNRGNQSHNILLGAPISASLPCCLQPGQEGNLSVDLPSGFEGTITYQCAIHGEGGMRGALLVGEPPATVRFLAPTNGSTVHGTSARVEVALGNVTLGSDRKMSYRVDGVALPNETGTSVTLGSLAPGNHLVQAEVVNATGASLSPPAAAEVVFFVDPTALPTTPTAPSDATPATSPSATPAKTPVPLALALLGVAAAALLFRRSR